jgi:hypothetical protein
MASVFSKIAVFSLFQASLIPKITHEYELDELTKPFSTGKVGPSRSME